MVRYKNRYGVFCVRLDRDDEKKHVVLSGRDVYYAIQNSLSVNYGDYGLGAALPSLQVRYFDPESGIGLIRMATFSTRVVWSSMTFISKIKNTDCHVDLCHLSGSIRTCKKYCTETITSMSESSKAALLDSLVSSS